MSTRCIATQAGFYAGRRLAKSEEFEFEGDPDKLPRWALPVENCDDTLHPALNRCDGHVGRAPSGKPTPEIGKPDDTDPMTRAYRRDKARHGPPFVGFDTKPPAAQVASAKKAAAMAALFRG